jgi:hypothetical protein
MMSKLVLLLLAVSLAVASCSDDTRVPGEDGGNTDLDGGDVNDGGNADTAASEDPLWAAAWAVLSTQCGPACHNLAGRGQAGLSLPPDDEATARANAVADAAAIRTSIETDSMPQGSPLSDADKQAVFAWIDAL